MTVLTKVKVSKKEDEPAQTHLVGGNAPEDVERMAEEDEVDANAVRYMVLSQRARRINGSSICMLTAILLISSLSLFCGLFYYRQTHKNERLHAWCSIPYQGSTNNEDLLSDISNQVTNFQSKLQQAAPDRANQKQEVPVFHEEFDINIVDNTESMFVPQFEWGQSASFLNDFNFGQTAIMPTSGSRCLVVELDRNIFLNPAALSMRVVVMEDGLDESMEPLDVVRMLLRARMPALNDTRHISPFIRSACAELAMFMLEERTIIKRSAEAEAEKGAQYAVFGGHGVIQYNIVNMADLE